MSSASAQLASSGRITLSSLELGSFHTETIGRTSQMTSFVIRGSTSLSVRRITHGYCCARQEHKTKANGPHPVRFAKSNRLLRSFLRKETRDMTTRAIGDVRPSQVITT